jgi:hypothetical protein
MTESSNFCVCSSREPRRAICDSRQSAMDALSSTIKSARDTGGSAGMLDNGRWELHFPHKAMILFWVEDSNGDIQKLP